MEPGSTPSGCTGELPSPGLPGLTGSFPQVLNQWFQLGLKSSHVVPNDSIKLYDSLRFLGL